MQIESVSVTAEWSVAGMAASYQGSKSFSLNIDTDEPADLIAERARSRTCQLDTSVLIFGHGAAGQGEAQPMHGGWNAGTASLR